MINLSCKQKNICFTFLVIKMIKKNIQVFQNHIKPTVLNYIFQRFFLYHRHTIDPPKTNYRRAYTGCCKSNISIYVTILKVKRPWPVFS